jgi:hypothetical protein
MIVRIRLRHGPVVEPRVQEEEPPRPAQEAAAQDPGKVTHEELAHGVSMLLVPIYLCAWAMAAWRLGADMRIMGPFFLSDGLFSHWQVWFALAILLQTAAKSLRRRARVIESRN